ncbi:hypothetical protein NC652_001045 [Populus alba x Populus x berolinensis]|nr:hypothetical protein NC652_001045 [Populus alba x Populus x berolinensis]
MQQQRREKIHIRIPFSLDHHGLDAMHQTRREGMRPRTRNGPCPNRAKPFP